jgi:RimJ/RimL family protein N-acetyltransferase
MMAEPLSRLQPPSPDGAEERVRPSPVHGASGEKLEWVIVDYDAAKMPGAEIFLPGLWKRMHDDGTFAMFFHEGPEMSFVQFGTVLASSRIQLIIGHDSEGTAKEHAGLLMLDHILINENVKRAVGNFMFFREYWHRHDSLEIGHAVLDHWFLNMGFDVIAGITPRANRAAVQFIKRLGFQIVGDVPNFTMYEGKQCASATSFMTREMWLAKREGK